MSPHIHAFNRQPNRSPHRNPSARRSPRQILLAGLVAAVTEIAERCVVEGLPVTSADQVLGLDAERLPRLIALYACHVVFSLTLTDLAAAAGLNRSTVSRGCARIEDRRDDPGFDRLIGAVEVAVRALSLRAGGSFHG